MLTAILASEVLSLAMRWLPSFLPSGLTLFFNVLGGRRSFNCIQGRVKGSSWLVCSFLVDRVASLTSVENRTGTRAASTTRDGVPLRSSV